MGDILAVLSIIFMLLVWYFLAEYKLSKLKTRVRMLDDVYTTKENAAAAIAVLEGLIRNLNAICRDHQKRLDILESGHPDSAFDYATTDDDGNITEVWFEGKKYVPEDKRDEDAVAFYADGRIVAETTKPEERHCCATCQHYRPGPDHTCTIRPWLHVTKEFATNAHSTCNDYKKVYTPTKGQVDCPYIAYENMDGNGKTEQLLKRAERLDYIYSTGLISRATYRNMMEELMQNDT